MSKESPELRPVPKRIGITINVLLQLVLAVLLFAGINFLGYRNYWRWDLSPKQDYSLSSATTGYLKKLNKDVDITVVLPRDSKIADDMRALADEYKRLGKKLIRTEFIDPVRDIERAEKLKVETGIKLAQAGVLVQANKRSRFISEEEIHLKVQGSDAQNAVQFFRGEDAITSAIISLIEGKTHKFYFIVGKGAKNETTSEEAFTALKDIGAAQNFEVHPLNLAEVSAAIPEDASGLILVGARYDLSEREIELLRKYWSAKRGAILVMLDPAGETMKLDAFLDTCGVKPRKDRVLLAESTSAGPQKRFEAEGIFSTDTVITKPLVDTVATFSGQSQSLNIRVDDKKLAEQSIVITPLIKAAERFWGETQYTDALPIANGDDTLPPVWLAAAVERGAAPDQRVRADSSRMVVVGNASLLDKKTILAVNRDFIAASLNWMLNRERLIGVTPKIKSSYRIQLPQHQHNLLFWITAFLAPATVLGLGFFVWAARRSS